MRRQKKAKRNPKAWLTKRGIQAISWLFKRIGAHAFGYILIAALLFGAYKYIETRSLLGLFTGQRQQILSLQKGQKRMVQIDFRRKQMTTIVRSKDGSEETITRHFSGLRRATIIENDDGSVKVTAPTLGLTLEPGFSSFLSRGRPHLGLDLEWFYWRRFGLSSGAGIGSKVEGMDDKSLSLAAYPLALNYNAPLRWTPNTNLFFGVDDQMNPTGGLSVKW